MMVTAEKIQENLTQLIERSPEWLDTEEEKEEKEEKNFHENVSPVINRWIHRQGQYEQFGIRGTGGQWDILYPR